MLRGLDSHDVVEIYMALWAEGCINVDTAVEKARQLLTAPEKYRRLVGWYFISSINNPRVQHHIAMEFLDVRDKEELSWICTNLHINQNLYHAGYFSGEQVKEEEKYIDFIYPTDKEGRAESFDKIAQAMEFIGAKNTVFEGSVFPWMKQTLRNQRPSFTLLSLMAYDFDAELSQKVIALLPVLNVDARRRYYNVLVKPEEEKGRDILLKGLSDRSQWIREDIMRKLKDITLSPKEITLLTGSLTSKSATLRKSILTLLENQEEALILPTIEQLMTASNKNMVLAGVELLNIFSKKNPKLLLTFQDQVTKLLSNEKTSKDLVMALEQVVPKNNKKEEFTPENGYGLYDLTSESFRLEHWMKRRPAVPKRTDSELLASIVPDKKEFKKLCHRISEVQVKYADYEYEAVVDYLGTREKILLGNCTWRISPMVSKSVGNFPEWRNQIQGIEDYPLAEKWLEAAGEYAHNKAKLTTAISLFNGIYIDYRNKAVTYQSWFSNIFKKYPIISCKDFFEKPRTSTVYSRVNQILGAIYHTAQGDLFKFAFEAYVNLVDRVPVERLGEQCQKEKEKENPYYFHLQDMHFCALDETYFWFWRNTAYQHIKTDEEFIEYFSEMWYQYLATKQNRFYGLQAEDMFRAHALGLITDEGIYRYLLDSNHMHTLTNTWGNRPAKKEEIFKKYPEAKRLLDTVCNRVVAIEIHRGELATSLTQVAMGIHAFEGGVKHFVNLLKALGDTGFYRGYSYSYHYHEDYTPTKQQTLSHLLKNCRPKEGETSKLLRDELKKAKITENRAIQAALFAPVWSQMIEEALEIPGLKSGVWFFHAHVNEGFSAEKETEVAVYSSITPERFAEGTFDKEWFYHAYESLGEKRFQTLYKNAKYITDSNITHKRSQRYSDAILGRLSKEELESEIIAKRNQEKLRAYALIPLESNDAKPSPLENEGNDSRESLQRYEFIMKFLKEGRQFGAARRASEAKACQVALENLAITTGYHDVDRMVWALEGEKIKQLEPLMQPYAIGEHEVWLNLSKEGVPSVKVNKNGKELKSVPKAIAKEEQVMDIKEAVKELREQKSRARTSFETAMISRTAFHVSEIKSLLCHPILQEMVASLVFTLEGITEKPTKAVSKASQILGFPMLENETLGLKDSQGNIHRLQEDSKLIIAHPYDMIQKNQWSSYQQYLYQEQMVQPFKQIFREYYPITEDEKAARNNSRRYAGNQVQPQKTVALLKNRGWTVDYDEGLQRVWHKENMIARIYAMADWFSPAEIEAPTLEELQFYSRDKWQLVNFEEIHPIIFSETMRDVDLAVSVAHVGGVDPEASHSTIEMRVAMTRELLAMLSIENVTFQSAHAQIKGELGEYSVHMGSGVIHQKGVGMVSVLPVHSQSRGRIFLPFVDDDPKTAEIMSKILLFADDKKIKDPTILEQIKNPV